MAEVKWIKLTVDMFDNRKIKHLRKLPDGDSIVLIWVMLLTMAGRCNAGGMIFLTENIPYTPKMLADELGFGENTVKLALESLEALDMIRNDGFLSVAGWAEHQNVDGMEKIREQAKLRMREYRARQKQLTSGRDVTRDVTVTQSDATDIEEDIDKDIDKDTESNTGRKKGIFQEFAGEDKTLLKALKEFNTFRNAKKKPMTDGAKQRICAKLERDFPREDWVAVIQQSIDKGWTDIYPIDRVERKAKGRNAPVECPHDITKYGNGEIKPFVFEGGNNG